MDELLVLTHRFPYPPDKGDKIRSWNFLRYLADRYHLYLGTFVDERRDWSFVETLRGLCRDCFFAGLDPRLARLRSLQGFISGSALTVPYYFDRGLDHWARSILGRPGLSRIFIYCSAMAQYIPLEIRRSRRCVADLVDIDSEKWFEYGRTMHGLKARISQREGTTLRRIEREIASTFGTTVVATQAERALFQNFAPESAERIACIRNGVDTDYFSPERHYVRPWEIGGTSLVFTGAMDYWPNIDAVIHFAKSVLPLVRQQVPDTRLIVVGSNPSSAVKALANGTDIIVTGRVPDVRPYVAHANAIVAPLRIARGVQNKMLEGMAMAKPVIASREAAIGIEGQVGEDFLVAENAEAFVAAIQTVVSSPLGNAIGQNARRRVLADYDWSISAGRLEAALNA